MRPVLAMLFIAFVSCPIGPAGAAQQWCAITSEGAANCSFGSIDQCRAEVSGTGGNCIPEAPVGHLQPRGANARGGPAPRDEKLDALLEKVNRKNDKLQICRGC